MSVIRLDNRLYHGIDIHFDYRSWCTWVNQNLRQGQNSVFEQIQNCYPGKSFQYFPLLGRTSLYYSGGSNGQNTMVMLEQQANVFKNYAMFDTERLLVPGNAGSIQLVDPAKWALMCPTKQVARLRAAAGVASYMNDFTVKLLTRVVLNHLYIDRFAKTLFTTITASGRFG